MKKNLLCAALFMGALCANAQVEVAVTDGSNVPGLNETTAESVVAGTAFGSSENITVSAAYDDTYKIVSCAFQGYESITVNGTTATFANGVAGQTNPSGQSLGADTSTPPTSGAVMQIDVKKDGYIVVASKLSSHKEYYVWEGDANFAMPVAYSLYMDWSAAALATTPTLEYTVPADADGYMDFTAADIDKYLNGAKAAWPEKIVLGKDAADVKKNGVGAIVFPVYAEAGTYLVHAAGSKISVPVVLFSENPITELKISGFAPLPDGGKGDPISITFIENGGGTGIENVEAVENAKAAPVKVIKNGQIMIGDFNIAGQRVK